MQPTLIFDMDGVLVDTRNSYCKLLVDCYKHFSGKEITFKSSGFQPVGLIVSRASLSSPSPLDWPQPPSSRASRISW